MCSLRMSSEHLKETITCPRNCSEFDHAKCKISVKGLTRTVEFTAQLDSAMKFFMTRNGNAVRTVPRKHITQQAFSVITVTSLLAVTSLQHQADVQGPLFPIFGDISMDMIVCAPKQRAPLLMHQAAPYLLQEDASHSSSYLSFAALQNLIQDSLQGESWTSCCNIQNSEDGQN